MKNISKKSVALVKKMESYLLAKGINRFELKRIRADIVSMIAEAEARGDSADSIFPNGGQDFCDEVLKNAVKKRWYEYVLSILSYMAISFAVAFPIVVFGTYLFPNEGEAVRGVIIDVDAVDLIIPFLAATIGSGTALFTNRYVFTKKRIAILLIFIALIPLVAVIIVLALYGAFGENSAIISINWVALWITVTAVAVLESVLSFVLAKRNTAKR